MQQAAERGGGGRRKRERAGEGEVGRSAGDADGVGGDTAGRAERGREEVVRRGAAGDGDQGRGAAQGGDVRIGRRRSPDEVERAGRREEIGAGEDAVGDGGRDGGELQARARAWLETERGARGARGVGGDVQRGRAAVGGHAQDAEAGRGRQRADGLGERAARERALVFEDAAREARALDGVGAEGEGAPVRDDVGAAARRSIRTELERAARDRDVAGEVRDRAEGQRRGGRDGRADGIIEVDRGADNARDNRAGWHVAARHRHARDDAGGAADDETAGVRRAAAGDRDAGGRGARIVGRGRSVQPGRGPDLDQRGLVGPRVVLDDAADFIDHGGRRVAAEIEVLAAAARGGDAVGHDERGRRGARLIRVKEAGARGAGQIDELRRGLARARAGSTEVADGGAVELQGARGDSGVESAHAADDDRAAAGVEAAQEVRAGAEQGHRARAALAHIVGDRRRREDAAGDEHVAVAAEGEGTDRAVGLAPEVGVERDEAVGIVVERGAVRAAAADEIPERALGRGLEGGTVTIATVDMEERVGGERAELAELDRLADELAAESVVEEEVRVRVIADVDLAGGEAGRVVGADLEAAVVDVDRAVAEAEAERRIGRDTDGAPVDADRAYQGVAGILQPERRVVDQAGLLEAVITGIHAGQQARGDEVALTEHHHGVAAGEVGVALQGRDAARGEEARVVAVTEGDATGEGVVADRHDRAGGIGRARSATGAGNFAGDRQAGHRRGDRALDDERATAETGVARIAVTEDPDRRRAEAELAGVRDDEITAADGDIAGEGITVVRKHQRAVAGLEEAADTGDQ